MTLLSIAFRSIIKNIKTSIICILSIVLAIVLISGTGQVVQNLETLLICDSEVAYGRYHVFGSFPKENILEVKNTLKKYSDEYGFGMGGFFAEIEEHLYTWTAGNENEFILNGYIVLDGKYPTKAGEVALSANELHQMGGEVGDVVSFPFEYLHSDGETVLSAVENQPAEMTICGIVERYDSPIDKNYTEVIVSIEQAEQMREQLDGVDEENLYKLSAHLNDISKRDELKNELSHLLSERGLFFNESLLKALESRTLDITYIAISLIVMLISSMCIYSVLNISLVEQRREFGVMRCIGFTNSNIRTVIILQSLFYLVVASPIGIFAGWGISRTIFSFVTSILEGMYVGLDMSFSPLYAGISLIFSFIVIVIVSVISSHNVSKITPIEAFRQSEQTETRQKKSGIVSALAEKILGIRGKIAYENVTINRTRTFMTIGSIAISIAGIIAIMFWYNNYIVPTPKNEALISDYILEPEVQDNTGIFSEKDIENIRDLSGVSNVKGFNVYSDAYFNMEGYPLSSYGENVVSSKGANVNMYGYDDEFLSNMSGDIVEGEIDVKKMKTDPIVVISSRMIASDEPLKYNIGDTITLSMQPDDGKSFELTAKVGAIISDMPYSLKGIVEGPYIAFSREYLINQIETEGYTSLYIDSDELDDEKTYLLETALMDISFDRGVQLNSYKRQLERKSKEANAISAIVLFFTVMVIVICFLNIINNIYTNLMLRIRELGTIRAVGGSKRDLSAMIMYEGLLWGVFSSIIGLVFGIILSVTIGLNMSEISLSFSVFPHFRNIILILANITICVLIALPAMFTILRKDIVEMIRD